MNLLPARVSLSPLLATLLAACSTAHGVDGGAWQVSGSEWRTDSAWYDGRAETCTYEASLDIYGAARSYTAVVHTLHQHMDAAATTKSDSGDGVAVFKQIATEHVPTENYDYQFSLTTFTRSDDLALFKLTRAVSEQCGASFTQLWREGTRLSTLESGYFPGESLHQGSLHTQLVAFEQLPLLLRDHPFDSTRGDRSLTVLPSLRSNRLVPLEPAPRTVRYVGVEALELPIGNVRAHRLDLLKPDGTREAAYWFHAEGGAPWLHVLVAYEGPGGHAWRLASHTRGKYWERP